MSLLQKGDKVAFIACSDGRDESKASAYSFLEKQLEQFGIYSVYAKTFYANENTPFSGAPKQRAAELMKLYADKEIKAIFDLSGGNSANEVLSFIDSTVIKKNPKPFIGISDLSVLNNALFALTGVANLHYQAMNLIGPDADFQKDLFAKVFLESWASPNDSVTFSYKWLRGSDMSGCVIGGNARCLLKLAGTRYMPDPEGKLLFLESLGGGPAAIASYFAQLDQLGIFEKCTGILLGTFTYMEKNTCSPSVEELLLQYTEKYRTPIAKTEKLGHGADSHCIPIGMHLEL